MSATMGQQGKIPPQVIVITQIVTGAFMACIYILLPAVFLFFYHRASVRATCQRRDPQIRWTDRCPMPVLALSILLAWGAACCLFSMVAYRGVMPLFGVFASGTAGAVVILFDNIVAGLPSLGHLPPTDGRMVGDAAVVDRGSTEYGDHVLASEPNGLVREDRDARSPVGNDAEDGHRRNDVSLGSLDGLGRRGRVPGLSAVCGAATSCVVATGPSGRCSTIPVLDFGWQARIRVVGLTACCWNAGQESRVRPVASLESRKTAGDVHRTPTARTHLAWLVYCWPC